MRATVMRNGELAFATVPDPEPGPGEVLVKTLACGICGSDLHVLEQAARRVAAGESDGPFGLEVGRDVVMGHEFCAEVVDFGAGTQRHLKPGTRVVSHRFTMGDWQPDKSITVKDKQGVEYKLHLWTIGKPVFAQSTDGNGEDEGWVLTFAYDPTRDKSDLIIIDAQDFDKPPVARIHMPTRVPFGFHGSWIAD